MVGHSTFRSGFVLGLALGLAAALGVGMFFALRPAPPRPADEARCAIAQEPLPAKPVHNEPATKNHKSPGEDVSRSSNNIPARAPVSDQPARLNLQPPPQPEPDLPPSVKADSPPAKGILSGTVVDSQGRPLEGARVGTYDGWQRLYTIDERTVTDAAGRFRCELAPGGYSLSIALEGYLPTGDSRHVTINAGEEKDLGVIQFRKQSILRLQLADAHGKALAGASVRLTFKSASGALLAERVLKTGEDGALTVIEPPLGECRLVLGGPGWLEAAPLYVVTRAEEETDLGQIILHPDVGG